MSRLPGQRWLVILGVLAALGLALGSAAWSYLQARAAKVMADPERARRQDQPIPVVTARVEEADVEQVIGATALTTASETATIRIGPSAGFKLTDVVLKKVYVHEGDQVKKNDLLLDIEDGAFQDVLQERKALLETARAQLSRVEEQVRYTEQIRQSELKSAEENLYYRKEDLRGRTEEYQAIRKLNTTRAASDFAYYDALSKYLLAKFEEVDAHHRLERARAAVQVGRLADAASVAQAKGAVEKAQLDHDVARRDVERCRVKSPLDGFVNKIEVVPGDVVNVDSVIITQVLKLDPIFVRVDFPQERIDELRLGLPAEVVFDCFPRDPRPFTGKVVRISPQVNPQLRVLPVVVEVKNPEYRIKAGVSSFARLKIARRALTVPARAVVEQGRRAMAFRVESGRARAVAVLPGHLVDNEMLEVRGGLAARDEVVVFHNFYRHPGDLTPGDGYLKDGDRVDVDYRKWARR